MSDEVPEGYDMTYNQYLGMQSKGIVGEMDNLLEHYKLAESMYSYKNLEGENDVRNFLINIFREVNNQKGKGKENLA